MHMPAVKGEAIIKPVKFELEGSHVRMVGVRTQKPKNLSKDIMHVNAVKV